MAHEYKVGDRVEADRWDGDPRNFAEAVVEYVTENGLFVYVAWPDGMRREFGAGSKLIRPLPQSAAADSRSEPPAAIASGDSRSEPPFKVGDEVEVLSARGDKLRCVVTTIVGSDICVEGVGFGYGAWIDWKKEPHRIVPYTPPQTRRVPLTAADVPPGAVVRDADWGGDSWAFVTGVSPSGIEANEAHNGVTQKPGAFFLVRHFSFRELLGRDFAYATPTDRNPDGSIAWKPCWKEEVVNGAK